MDFFDRQGPVALGSRLRRLGDWLAEDAARVYAAYGTPLQPRWYPVFQVLAERRSASVTEIAREIGHSHASVSQIIAEMRRKGFVTPVRSKRDARSTVLKLSRRAAAAKPKLQEQWDDARTAVEGLLGETEGALWEALGSLERALAKRSFLDRTLAARARRQAGDVTIVDYEPRHRTAFRRLNEAWIKEHFTLEKMDRDMLNDPEGNILKPGGHILVALLGGKPVGVCALVPHGDRCFELAKITVSAAGRGRGIGQRLGEAAIERARQEGATRLYLETNTALKPAIALYRKLRFTEVKGGASPYARCNLQMERAI